MNNGWILDWKYEDFKEFYEFLNRLTQPGAATSFLIMRVFCIWDFYSVTDGYYSLTDGYYYIT